MTSVQIGIGLYLVGVMTLTGFVVAYLARTPPTLRMSGAALGSGIFAALLWPFVLVALVVAYVRLRWRLHRARKESVASRLVSRQVKRAEHRRVRRNLIRSARASNDSFRYTNIKRTYIMPGGDK